MHLHRIGRERHWLTDIARRRHQYRSWVMSGHFALQSRCPLYSRKRTSIGDFGMSALCHKRTWLRIGANRPGTDSPGMIKRLNRWTVAS